MGVEFMSIISFIILYFILRFFFADLNTVILISLGAAIWLCGIRIFLKVDNIERKLGNVESKYEDIMKHISDTSNEEKSSNIPDDTNNVEHK